MILEVEAVRYLHDYILWLRFNDGAEGTVDLADELTGPVFGPLADKRKFRAVRVDPLLRTVVWPNEADLAPEFLHDRLTHSVPLSRSSKSGRKVISGSRMVHSDSVAHVAREKRASYGSKRRGKVD